MPPAARRARGSAGPGTPAESPARRPRWHAARLSPAIPGGCEAPAGTAPCSRVAIRFSICARGLHAWCLALWVAEAKCHMKIRPRKNPRKKKQKTAINSSENWKIASSHKRIQENPHQNWKKSMLSNAKLLNICLHHFAAKFAQETPSKKDPGVRGRGRAKISTPFRANCGPIVGQWVLRFPA